jgi:hypothetical protein
LPGADAPLRHRRADRPNDPLRARRRDAPVGLAQGAAPRRPRHRHSACTALGSVSHGLLQEADRPVVIVPAATD